MQQYTKNLFSYSPWSQELRTFTLFILILISRRGFYNVKTFGAKSPVFRPSLTLLAMTGTRRQKWCYKLHVISNEKKKKKKKCFSQILARYLFSVRRILEGLLGKMVSQRAIYVLYIGLYSFWPNRRKHVRFKGSAPKYGVCAIKYIFYPHSNYHRCSYYSDIPVFFFFFCVIH